MTQPLDKDTAAKKYHFHRKESDHAFTAGDAAVSVGHASAAHSILITYGLENGISTDDAAAILRRHLR